MDRKNREQERREEATARIKERSKRTPYQQIECLDKKLGEGIGAQKERSRLHIQIAEQEKRGKK